MKSTKLLTLALLPLIAAPAAAFAQDTSSASEPANSGWVKNSTTNGDADAAYKPFAVVGGITMLTPQSRPLDHTSLDIDGATAPTLSFSWYATPNWAVELWGAAGRFEHDVRDDTGKLGTIKQQPLALSAQYHFFSADKVFRPFVGVGYYQSNISGENITPAGSEHVGVDTAHSAIGTAGIDFNISPTWFARVDARYMDSQPEINVGGHGTGQDLDLNPWTVGLGVGARF